MQFWNSFCKLIKYLEWKLIERGLMKRDWNHLFWISSGNMNHHSFQHHNRKNRSKHVTTFWCMLFWGYIFCLINISYLISSALIAVAFSLNVQYFQVYSKWVEYIVHSKITVSERLFFFSRKTHIVYEIVSRIFKWPFLGQRTTSTYERHM